VPRAERIKLTSVGTRIREEAAPPIAPAVCCIFLQNTEPLKFVKKNGFEGYSIIVLIFFQIYLIYLALSNSKDLKLKKLIRRLW
jgi:hypothetical protein